MPRCNQEKQAEYQFKKNFRRPLKAAKIADSEKAVSFQQPAKCRESLETVIKSATQLLFDPGGLKTKNKFDGSLNVRFD